MSEKQKKEQGVSYRHTLNLPRTDIPMRPQSSKDDPEMLERWQAHDLYKKTFFAHKGHKKFILHDGPPYANGHIHLGHALNKILKDIIAKAQRMMGKHVPVTPGWDCHGLPIELKVSQEHPHATAAELKKACREYANHWIGVQKKEFERLGILMDWNDPYLTMNPSYEASILKVLAQLVDQGYVEHKNKTVPWCPSCQTVLATAEIEYAERKDPSVYTLFPITAETAAQLFPEIENNGISFVVWTTTPWTLPLNRAVLLRPGAVYVVLDIEGEHVVVAEQLADALCEKKGVQKKIVARFNADQITRGMMAHHPFIENLQVPILLDQSVLLEDGTAIVHSAPGCGPDDYEVGIKNGLEIFSPISADGKYTHEIEPKELEGMPVADGQWWVLKKLKENGTLFFKENIKHAYPHCWRCHGGLIFRATKQWFCNLEKNNLKQRVLDAIDTKITTVPKKSINRLKATVEGRLEWCLSRQRVWGVPIPAIMHDASGYVYTSKVLIDHVADQVAQHGIEWWDTVALKDVLPQDFDYQTYPLDELRKETDILDVWFDAGVSYFAVLLHNEHLGFPADLYLEGKDQHRGWFQSSLLTSMITEGEPPMKMVMTHGFTVDPDGKKMSKSIGNVTTPQEMIDVLGTDGLRLWVSSVDASGDAVVSDVVLTHVKEVFRKIRNTCRFLDSNLYDFTFQDNALAPQELLALDVMGLQELYVLNQKVLSAYQRMDITHVFHLVGDYVSVQLSSFYLDIVKDRLYTEKSDGKKRRSAQTACWYILDTLTRLIAPILSFTAEQLSDCYQDEKKESIHLQQFASLHELRPLFGLLHAQDSMIENKKTEAHARLHFERGKLTAQGIPIDIKETMQGHEQFLVELKSIRSAVLKSMESLREQGIIKHGLEAEVTLHISKTGEHILEKLKQRLQHSSQSLAEFLKELFIVSACTVKNDNAGLSPTGLEHLFVKVERAQGRKCPRCWQWHNAEDQDDLCDRCYTIVSRVNEA